VGPAPQYAEVLDWGLPLALWQEAARAQVAEHVDQLCPNPLISHADRKGPETVGSILPEVVWTLDFWKLQ